MVGTYSNEFWLGHLIGVLQLEVIEMPKKAYLGLSNREYSVVHGRITLELTHKEIAQHLGITERTVKHHMANIYRKLLLNSTHDHSIPLIRLTKWVLGHHGETDNDIYRWGQE